MGSNKLQALLALDMAHVHRHKDRITQGSCLRSLCQCQLIIFPALPPPSSSLWCNQMAEGAAIWHNEARRGPQRMDWGGKMAFRECHNMWLKIIWTRRSMDKVSPLVEQWKITLYKLFPWQNGCYSHGLEIEEKTELSASLLDIPQQLSVYHLT